MASFLVGLTGGMASGKSTVIRWLGEAGFPVLDADRVVADLYAPEERGTAAVRELFGDAVLAADGSVDRPKLGQVVFSDPDARKRLERAIHPLVGQRFREIAAETEGVLIYEGTLLVEAGRATDFDLLISVETTPEVQLERAIARGMDKEAAQARLEAQGTGDLRRDAAHRILRNDDSLEDLRVKVDKLAVALTEFDAATRFRARAAAGSPEEGLRLLDKLDDLDE